MKTRLRPGVNPIIVKELRSRMRGPRAFVILTAVLLLMAVISFGLYRLILATAGYGGAPLGPQIGQGLFTGLLVLELLTICFVTPALTAGAISGEREMQTYEMLLATPLEPASILRGKLFSALVYVLLLIFAAVPMSSLVFTFGGVSPRDMVKALVVLVAVTVTLGVVGVFMSAWLRRTGRATVLTYLLVLALLIGPYLVYIFAGVMRRTEPPNWILIPSPVSALFSALTPPTTSSASLGLAGGLGLILSGRIGVVTGSTGVGGWPRPLYHYSLVLYGGLSLGLYLLTTRLVRPARRWRLARRQVLGAVAVCLLFAALVAAAFLASAGRYEWRDGGASSGAFRPTEAPWPVPPPAVVVERPLAVAPMPTEALPASPLPTPTRNVVLPADEESAIYAAVVRQLYTVDHSFGDQAPNFPVLYLLTWTDDSVGDPAALRADSRLLLTDVQESVAEALADLPTEVRWIASRDDVILKEDGGRVKDGGAIVTLGNVFLQDDGSVHVSASLYFAALGAVGKTYVLDQIDGAWQIVGDTGVEWVS